MEQWGLYDEKFHKKEMSYVRSSEVGIPDGMYHIAIRVYIVNRKNQLFIKQRSENTDKGLLWGSEGGSLIQGEDCIDACIRELREKISLVIDASMPVFFKEECGINWKLECYYVLIDDIDISELKLQIEKIKDAKLVKLNELIEMDDNNILVDGVYDFYAEVLNRINGNYKYKNDIICEIPFKNDEERRVLNYLREYKSQPQLEEISFNTSVDLVQVKRALNIYILTNEVCIKHEWRFLRVNLGANIIIFG